MKLSFLTFVGMFIPFFTYSQTDSTKKLMQNDITLAYDNRVTEYNHLRLHYRIPKRKIQIFLFLEEICDSVSIFLNDKIVHEKHIQSSKSSLTYFTLDGRPKKSKYIKISFRHAGKYIEFPWDIRYKFVGVHYRKNYNNDNDFWDVNFTNNVPQIEP